MFGSNDNFQAIGLGESFFTAQNAPISTVGYTNVYFSFWWLCEGDATSMGDVYYRTSAGGSWTPITAMIPTPNFYGSSTWTRDSIHLPAFDGQAFLEFGFQFTDGSGSGLDPAFGVDDIMVTGTGGGGSTPVVTVPPASVTICEEVITSFTATVTGATIYQWQRSTTGYVGTYVDITAGMDGGIYGSSYTTATLTITGATVAENGYAYRLVATNVTGATTSAPALLTVNPAPNAGSITGSSSICIGGTTSLADATTGGTWSSTTPSVATVSTSGVVSSVAVGTTVISYTVSNSCGTAAATMTVNVTSTASAGTITGTSTDCIGSTITLADATTGGTWTSGTTSVATIDASGVVTGVAIGSTIVTYTVTSSCGTASTTFNVSVTATADAGTITGSATSCVGSTATLTDAVTGGTWSSGTTTVATVDASGVVTGVATGSTIITYTVTSSCGTASTTFSMTVGSAGSISAITGADSVCDSARIILADATSGGTWSVSNANAVMLGDTVLGVSAGLDTVAYTITGGVCGTLATTFVVVVKQAPHPVVTMIGHVLTVPAVYSSYQWKNSTGNIAGATNRTYTFTTNGNYQVTVDSNGCYATSPAHTFNLSVNSIGNEGNIFSVYQNGNSAVILAAELLTETLDVKLYDATGRLVTSTKMENGTNTKQLDATWLANGMYIIRLSNESSSIVLKWVKQ